MRIAQSGKLNVSSVLAALAIVAAAGCARQHVATQSTIETASGEVGMMYSSENGLWMDRIGGVWLDSSGALRSGGGTGMTIGLTPSTVSQMTNANIVAHVLAGDSLEVRLSQLGETALQQPLVRDFSRRMVADYDADIQAARRAADSARVVPALAARDTFDTAMAGRLTSRIDSLPRVDPFNRGVMAAEVLVHKHLLNDLTMMRPRASGPTQALVDESTTLVRQRLAQAQHVWQDVAGKSASGVQW